jgi:EAL domain-containing protein (putative c-di-GMP-specific phosphodiesterase class I)
LSLLADESFEAAIVDYDLGDHVGLSVLAHLRDHQPMAIRILMTGHDDLPLVVAAVNRGEAFKVVRKPFQKGEVLELLRDARSSVEALTRASITNKVVGLKQERVSLAAALCVEQLGFALQPIVHAPSREVFGREALLRPLHPDYPGPVDLLLAVERHQRVDVLGERVLLGVSDLPVPADEKLFVNLHPLQLGDPTALERAVRPLLGMAGRVVFEITERSSLQALTQWESSVALLRDRGFALAVDDLGAGYSALAMLADLQPDYIKLDRSLLTDLHRSSRRRRLVQLLCKFGVATEALVIAEGIELEEEHEAALACGVELVQGYLYGAPQLIAR